MRWWKNNTNDHDNSAPVGGGGKKKNFFEDFMSKEYTLEKDFPSLARQPS